MSVQGQFSYLPKRSPPFAKTAQHCAFVSCHVILSHFESHLCHSQSLCFLACPVELDPSDGLCHPHTLPRPVLHRMIQQFGESARAQLLD